MNCPTVASVPSWMDSDNNRIVGGKNAPSPIPWQVSIGNADSGHWCGGTILDEETILSAAHCFTVSQMDWKGWYVMAGDTNKNGVKGQVIRILKKKHYAGSPIYNFRPYPFAKEFGTLTSLLMKQL